MGRQERVDVARLAAQVMSPGRPAVSATAGTFECHEACAVTDPRPASGLSRASWRRASMPPMPGGKATTMAE